MPKGPLKHVCAFLRLELMGYQVTVRITQVIPTAHCSKITDVQGHPSKTFSHFGPCYLQISRVRAIPQCRANRLQHGHSSRAESSYCCIWILLSLQDYCRESGQRALNLSAGGRGVLFPLQGGKKKNTSLSRNILNSLPCVHLHCSRIQYFSSHIKEGVLLL